MVVAIKEHVLIGIMQQSLKCRYRLAFKARQARCCFICACLDQPTCHGIAEGDDGIAGYVTRMSGVSSHSFLRRLMVWEGRSAMGVPIPIACAHLISPNLRQNLQWGHGVLQQSFYDEV